MVAVQEASSAELSLTHVAVAAVLQVVVVGAVGLPLAAVLRQSHRTLPVVAVLLFWALLGALRGVLGGMAALGAGAPPEFGYRIGVWIAVALVWMPPVTVVIAQLAHRRRLLASLGTARSDYEAALRGARRDSAGLRASVLAALQSAIMPTVSEISARLSVVGSDRAELQQLSSRLAATADAVLHAVETLGTEARPRRSLPEDPPAPLGAALAFERRSPVRWTAGGAGAVVVTALPLILHSGDDLVTMGSAVAAGVAVSMSALALVSGDWGRRRRSPGRPRFRDLVRYGVASVAAPVVAYAFMGGGEVDRFSAVLLGTLPVATMFSAATISLAVGCATANSQLVEVLRTMADESEFLRRFAEDEESRIRGQLTALTHGPIQGRLGACAMALNFLASGETPNADRLSSMFSSVLQHLDAVSADLAELVDGAEVAQQMLPPR